MQSLRSELERLRADFHALANYVRENKLEPEHRAECIRMLCQLSDEECSLSEALADHRFEEAMRMSYFRMCSERERYLRTGKGPSRYSPYDPKRPPSEWARDDGLRIIDPDGWRPGCKLGEKDFDEPITHQEYRERMIFSTICPLEDA